MPNWCYNSVSVSHSDPAMIDRFVKATEDERLFDEFVPMPEELRNTTSPSPTNESLVEKYGASDWYSWALDNWGTKWDIADAYVNVDKSDSNNAWASFETAWSPPLQFYYHLIDMGFKVDATYTEEGMGFAGHFVDGEDDCVDLSFDENSQEWINQMDNETLREIVQVEYDRWLEWQEGNEDA